MVIAISMDCEKLDQDAKGSFEKQSWVLGEEDILQNPQGKESVGLLCCSAARGPGLDSL